MLNSKSWHYALGIEVDSLKTQYRLHTPFLGGSIDALRQLRYKVLVLPVGTLPQLCNNRNSTFACPRGHAYYIILTGSSELITAEKKLRASDVAGSE